MKNEQIKSNTTATDMARGVFWVINDKLVAYPFRDDVSEGIAKSGNTFNHKKLWPHVKPKGVGNVTYNYHPRGRVEINRQGEPVVYLSPHIDGLKIAEIKASFGLQGEPQIRYDYSEHYKCHLDEDWVPEE